MGFTMDPVGVVVGGRAEWVEDGWGDVAALIRIADHLPDHVTQGLSAFSHLEVVFVFDRVDPTQVLVEPRRPRGDPALPQVGLFASRGPSRPNRLGVSRCRLDRIDGRDLHVTALDALEGTPVLDIKPYFREFAPATAVQPDWVSELLDAYY